jgi:uncharacterized protein DUF6105
MKWFIALWAVPMMLLGAWYTLSYYDLNFGLHFLSRDLHDLVFIVYGNILGIEPEAVPPLVLKAILVDTALVVAILVLRRKGYTLFSWIKSLFSRNKSESAAAPK